MGGTPEAAARDGRATLQAGEEKTHLHGKLFEHGVAVGDRAQHLEAVRVLQTARAATHKHERVKQSQANTNARRRAEREGKGAGWMRAQRGRKRADVRSGDSPVGAVVRILQLDSDGANVVRACHTVKHVRGHTALSRPSKRRMRDMAQGETCTRLSDRSRDDSQEKARSSSSLTQRKLSG
jgi:hypothetical protein